MVFILAISYSIILEYSVHCGFENGLTGSCAALKPNEYYDDTQGAGRKWDIFPGSAAEGANFWNAYTDNTGSSQVGTMSIIPTKVGGRAL